jgi:ADP-heptose:LPS heptosyltransferase
MLAWAIQRGTGGLLEGHPALDEVIQLPRRWLRSPAEVWRLRRRLRALRFDVTIDAQSLTKSAILAWLSGAKRRIGFGNPCGRELSKLLNNERVDPRATHVVDRYLELLRPLGIESPVVRFDVPERGPDRDWAEAAIRQMGVEGGFAIINPGAGWPSKIWPAERYAAVARHLSGRWQLPTVLVWAGQSERGLAEQIVARSGGAAQVGPPSSLPELAALARRARLFVSADTGPLHLAVAVGTPCVGLFGPWPASRHGPYGPRHVALQSMFFEGTDRARRTAPATYMESISTETVCEGCDRILTREEGGAGRDE